MFDWNFCDSVPEYHPLVDGNNLYESYKMSKRGSDWKKPVQLYEWDWMGQLSLLQIKLENYRLHKPDAYTTHLGNEFMLVERGKIRAITGLEIEDRIVRHSLNDFILMPRIRPLLIYDNGASIKHRGITFSRNRLEYHLHNYYKKYGTNEGWIMLLDVSKYYDNIRHDRAEEQLIDVVRDDMFVRELLHDIFKTYQVDVSYMSDEEYEEALNGVFVMNDYRKIKFEKCGKRMLPKSVLMGDQTSQLIGIFYPHRVDNFITKVEGNKFYARYMDDSYVIHPSKEYLLSLFPKIQQQYAELGLYLNPKKLQLCRLSDGFVYLQQKYTLLESGYVIVRMRERNVARQRRKLRSLPPAADRPQLFRSWMTPRLRYLSKQQTRGLYNAYQGGTPDG